MTPLERIRIEKAAADCSFEREPVLSDNGQLELRSALFPEVLSVSSLGASGFKVSALNPAMLGSTSCTEVAVENVAQLYAVLQYASAFARVMPNRVADEFRAKTQNLPRTTEAERTVVQRVGQDIFRNALMWTTGKVAAASLDCRCPPCFVHRISNLGRCAKLTTSG